MYRWSQRLGMLALVFLALTSFRLAPATGEGEHLLFDVRAAFVAARPDVPADLMQTVQYRITSAIETTVRDRMRPRVVLTVRLLAVKRASFLLGERVSARVVVRAAAVETGDVIAEASFTATVLGMDRSTIERDLADGIAGRIISEFKLTPPSPAPLATALFPGR